MHSAERFFFRVGNDILLEMRSGGTQMKRLVLEEMIGLLLLLMVFLAVKFGPFQAVSAMVQPGKEQPVVVIDAGHGGFDPGKVGVDGSLEKDINLQIALRLKSYLEQADVTVLLTRETDVDLCLDGASGKKTADMRNRCQKINAADADLAVSIHQNSYMDEAIFGGQVFYYQNSKEGKQLAELLQKRFTYVLGDQNRRLAKANDNYYLLLHVKCPIVIAECGFLSNRKEAAMLQQEEYQDRMAWTLHMVILEYLNDCDLTPT